MNSLVMH